MHLHQRLLPSTYIAFVEDRQTHSSRRIYIRMEEARWKLAFRGFARVVLAEVKIERKVATVPISLKILREQNRSTKGMNYEHLMEKRPLYLCSTIVVNYYY